MEKSLISIIIPIYNSEKYLKKCLDSLTNQTYTNLEIICVNDGSTDTSGDILAQYEKTDSRIKIITIPNGGISNARNTGNNYVTGQYIMYIDSDDWIEPQTCEKALIAAKNFNADVVFWNYVREFDSASKPQYIYGNTDKIFETKAQIEQLRQKFFGPYGEELANPEKLDSIVTVWGKLYRSDLIINNKVSFINTKEVVAEDLLFNVYAFSNVQRAVYLSDCFYHYRKTNLKSFTKKHSSNFMYRLTALYDYLEKYIVDNSCSQTFTSALNNRQCLNIIGIGMNLLQSDNSINKKKEIKKILCCDRFINASKTLSLKHFPLHWKIFFLLVKLKFSYGVYIMLKLIRYLKNR